MPGGSGWLSEQVHCEIDDECHRYAAEQRGVKDSLCMEFRLHIIFQCKRGCIPLSRKCTCDEQRRRDDTVESEHIDEDECGCRTEYQPAGQCPADNPVERADLYALKLHAEKDEGKCGKAACQLLD